MTLQKEDPSKLFVGKTALYRLLDLLRQAEADGSFDFQELYFSS